MKAHFISLFLMACTHIIMDRVETFTLNEKIACFARTVL